MPQDRINKLIALAGSICLSNGLLLLIAPARFATLRRQRWLPSAYNATLAAAPKHPGTSRAIGGSMVATGLTLLLAALRRTQPA